MDLREWALIAFTILMQMSVGAFVVLGIVHFFVKRNAGEAQADRMSDLALLALGPVLVLALLASLGHLSNPMRAPFAITNWANSWLSREILFSGAFVGVGGVFAILQWRKLGSFALRNVIAWAAAIIGLAAVYSMAQIYMLRTVPVWNTPVTVIQFFTTTFLLGSLAVGAAYGVNYAIQRRREPSCAEEQCSLLRAASRWIALVAVVMLGVEFVVLPMYMAWLAGNPLTAAAGQLLVQDYGWMLFARLALVFLGAGVVGLLVYRYAVSAANPRMLGTLMMVAFALALVGEVLGRYLFYVSHTGSVL